MALRLQHIALNVLDYIYFQKYLSYLVIIDKFRLICEEMYDQQLNLCYRKRHVLLAIELFV